MYDTLTVPGEKSKIGSCASSIMKNIVVSPTGFWAKFPVKVICFIYFASTSSA